MEKIVEADELNLFGGITGLDEFKEMDDDDFGPSGRLWVYGSTENGFTCSGFTDYLAQNLSDEEFKKIMDAFGYDEYGFSIKSRNFIISIHSDSPVNC